MLERIRKYFIGKWIGYNISVVRPTNVDGENVQVTTNMAFGATEDDLAGEILKITGAMDRRIARVNSLSKPQRERKLKELGIESQDD